MNNFRRKARPRSVNQCAICGKEFNRALYLRKHMITHTDEKKYACTWCPKKYRELKNLQYHMKKHTGVSEYVCGKFPVSFNEKFFNLNVSVDLCGREFSNEDLLIKHIPSHSTNNPWKCNVCRMTFHHQSTLSRHSKIHERVTQCQLCHQTFQFDSLLRKHLLEAHKDVEGIKLPRPLPVKVKVRKSTKKVESDQNSTESASYYVPHTIVVNNVSDYKTYYHQ
jgi:uncharacterized Zn-finger protein